MRTKHLALILLTVAASACSKSKSTPPVANDFSLPGTWRNFSMVGGIAGIHSTYPTSQGHISYIFRTDSSCSVISDGTTTNSAYHVVMDSSRSYGSLHLFLNIDGIGSQLMGNAHDTLWLSVDGISDGMAYGFVKDK